LSTTRISGRRSAILPTLIIAAVLVVAFAIFTSFWTDRLWYTALDFGTVFTTMLVTRIALFVAFGILMAVMVGGNAVLADSGLLERVLANLVDNALRYAPDSAVRIAAAPVKDRVLITVADTIAPVVTPCLLLGLFAQPVLDVMYRDVGRLAQVADGARARVAK